MISLKIQLISFCFSFFYGVLFCIFINLSKAILFNTNVFIKCFGTLFFMLDVSLLYFVIVKFFNYGLLHLYFLIMFGIGWGVMVFFLNRCVKK